MPSPPEPENSPKTRRGRVKFPETLDSLQEFCASLAPGDLIPTHTELMRRFDTSERAVLKALEEMQRDGKIVRKRGVGTFVAERNAVRESSPIVPDSLLDTRTVVAILRPDHSFFDRCLDVLFQHAKAADLSVACRLIEGNSSWPEAGLSDVRPNAGFLVFNQALQPIARGLQEAGHRVVVLGTPHPEETPCVPCVYGDHEQGGFLAVRHLLELGHTRLLFAGFSHLDDSLRGRGHARALKTWNARSDSAPAQITLLSEEELASWEQNPARAQDFFARPDAPTAIVAWNDHRALGLLRTLNRAGVSVPEQVSLVGYDALPEGCLVHPALTTINPHIEGQLQSALGILTRVTPPPPSHCVVVVPTLVVRESSASPRF